MYCFIRLPFCLTSAVPARDNTTTLKEAAITAAAAAAAVPLPPQLLYAGLSLCAVPQQLGEMFWGRGRGCIAALGGCAGWKWLLQEE